MQVQYASDLHLEFNENQNELWHEPLIPKADILILAGDIVTFKELNEQSWFFDQISKDFKTTYWIPGNHEYYHYDLYAKRGSFVENIRENIFLVNDYAVTIENARLIFSTLWTDIRPRNQIAIEKRMNDFHLIRYHGNRLTAEVLSQLHKNSLAFIEQELTHVSPELKTIVVTHHVPTFIRYPEIYFGDVLNEAFAVELKHFIRKLKPDYWIYGHHHCNTVDFFIDNTLLLTNQMGYVRNHENERFDRSKIITI